MSLVTRIAQEFNDVRNHLPISTPYNLLQGSLSISNEVITNGFSTTSHTGNGGTQTVVTNVDMNTQWGNDVSEKFGGLSWLKSRSAATNNFLFDTIRGAEKEINSNTTEAEATLVGSLTAFSSTGFSVGSAAGINTNLATYVSWNFQTTHRRTGVTNHGKAFTEHYNPFTGFTIIKYEGSGLAGHEIPHSLGRKLGFWATKNLNISDSWASGTDNPSVLLSLNNTNATPYSSQFANTQTDEFSIWTYGDSFGTNKSGNQHILYGWANSYFDESNKLIGNYEVGVYQGTGATGNKVTTRGKPAWVMVKRLDVAYHWYVMDNLRASFDTYLLPSASNAEGSLDILDANIDGFTVKTTDVALNASGGQYLYMVVYDNDSGSGKSKYPKATDTTNLTINALVPYANGIDVNGSKVSISYKNETISGLTLTQGKNYIYSKNDGTYGSSVVDKSMVTSFSTVTSGAVLKGDEFHLTQNKWQVTTNTPRGDLANPSLVNVFGDGSCKALYRFEDNTNDESGTYNGVSANISYSTGILGKSAVFSTSSYMNLVANPIPFTVKTLSISNWIYGSTSAGLFGFGRKSGNVAYNGSYWFRVLGGIYCSGISQVSEYTPYNATTGRTGWNHYVTTLASNIVSIYVNGVLVNSWTLSTNEQNAINTYTNLYGINEEQIGLGSGQIDQIRIFNKAISDTEVKSLYDLYSYTYNQSSPRTYLDCIVYADHNGQPTYKEELPKTTYFDLIESASNRVVMYLSDYGIAQVQTNKRYVIQNPFGNDKAIDCDVKAEIYAEGMWGETGWADNGGTGVAGYGVRPYSTSNGIIVRTGSSGVYAASEVSGGPFAGSTLSSASARLIVTYKGKTRSAR